MGENCRHHRTRLIAEDDAASYVECLQCGRLFERGELEEGTAGPSPEFEEDLSDA